MYKDYIYNYILFFLKIYFYGIVLFYFIFVIVVVIINFYKIFFLKKNLYYKMRKEVKFKIFYYFWNLFCCE